LIDEDAMAAGKISHVVNKLWIDKKTNVGMGEILVLGTDSGRNLNTHLRSGQPIPVSSRAYGQISNERGPNGEDIIDEDSFVLETFDFVLNPGVDSAYPKVVENHDQPKEESTDMSKEILEALAKEKSDLQGELVNILKANEALKDEKANLEKKLETATKAFAFYQKNVGSIEETKKLVEGLRKWMQLEPLKAVASELGLLASDQNSPAEKISKLLPGTEALVAESIELKSKLAEFEAGAKDVEKATFILESYVKLGSPKEIGKRIKQARQLGKIVLEARKKHAAAKINKAYPQFTVEFVTEMLTKSTAKEVIKNLKKNLKSQDLTSRYAVTESKKVIEVASKKPAKASCLAESLIAGMNDRNDSNGSTSASLYEMLRG
jgi:hypothetical protein